MTRRTDENGNGFDLAYDGAGRVTQYTYGNNDVVSWGYGPVSQRTSLTDYNGTTTFAYGTMQRLTKVTFPDATNSESWAYAEGGNRTSWTTGNGDTVTYAYDLLDRVTLKTLPGTNTYVDYD